MYKIELFLAITPVGLSVIKPRCMAGFLTLRLSVCVSVTVCVCGQDISKSI